MAFKVTWNGFEPYEDGRTRFEPSESRYYRSREHIPTDLLMDYRFVAEAVPNEEAFPHEVVEEVLLVAEED